MPFDSEGNFSRLHNWEDDRINDIDIVTDHMDEEDNNFADGLSQCFLKSGLSKMQGNINANEFKITNLANGVIPSDAVNKAQLDNLSAKLWGDFLEFIAQKFPAMTQADYEAIQEKDPDTYYFITADVVEDEQE